MESQTEEVEARRVANRIRNVMAGDTEKPVSASVGIAVFHGKGERIDKLLSEADKQLYAEKRAVLSMPLPQSMPIRVCND